MNFSVFISSKDVFEVVKNPWNLVRSFKTSFVLLKLYFFSKNFRNFIESFSNLLLSKLNRNQLASSIGQLIFPNLGSMWSHPLPENPISKYFVTISISSEKTVFSYFENSNNVS